MNRKDIINIVKQPAIEVMQDRRVLASLLIAESILISEPYKEIMYNNPLRLRNLENDSFLKFDDIEDCFNYFIDHGIINSKRTNIIGNYNYKSLVKSLRLGETNENSLIEIIESYKLNDIDSDILSNIYSGKRTIVEIDTEPFTDFYRVRQAFSSDKTEVFSTFDRDEAIRECKKYYGCTVFNSRGKAIFTNALTPELKAKIELEEKVTKAPAIGTKVHLENVNLYEYPDSKTPMRSVIGDYYIYDSKRYNDRYMITNKLENIGVFALGYINSKDKK